MTGREFSDQFDVLYNNITSNQAPGLNEYEKSVVLTKAQDEIVKNYFLPNSQGNTLQQGYDGNAKRQMDFSLLMKTEGAMRVMAPANNTVDLGNLGGSDETDYNPTALAAVSYDPRGALYVMPEDLFIPINESLRFVVREEYETTNALPAYRYVTKFQRQVVPLTFEEYTRLMNKPYKEPLKNQAWRILVNNAKEALYSVDGSSIENKAGKLAEIIAGHNDLKWLTAIVNSDSKRLMQYIIRYIRRPKPILVAPIDSYGVSINGHDGHYTSEGTEVDYDDAYTYNDDHTEILNPCELDESIHEEILQRAVELAKIAWTATGQDNLQPMMESGKRSE